MKKTALVTMMAMLALCLGINAVAQTSDQSSTATTDISALRALPNVVLPNQGSAKTRQVMEAYVHSMGIQIASNSKLPTQAPVPALDPSPVPTPTPSPIPVTFAVAGTVTNPAGTPLANSYVYATWLNAWGFPQYLGYGYTRSDGAYLITTSSFNIPPAGTKFLVQATKYKMYSSDIAYQANAKYVTTVTGVLQNAGAIKIAPQLSSVWFEMFAIDGDVYLRVRRGASFPGTNLVSQVTASAPALTAFYRQDTQVQWPYDGGYWQPGWMHFSIPARAPKGNPICGYLQISNQSDPALVYSTEHGFCYSPVARYLYTW